MRRRCFDDGSTAADRLIRVKYRSLNCIREGWHATFQVDTTAPPFELSWDLRGFRKK